MSILDHRVRSCLGTLLQQVFDYLLILAYHSYMQRSIAIFIDNID